jgi:nucleoside 2-deoxyribosyltransferase
VKLYISGPMTGYPNNNLEEFDRVQLVLEELGYEVINPARHPKQESWADYMRLDILDVLAADGVALLDYWEPSRGAALEVFIANALLIPVMPYHRWRGEN